MADTNTLYDIDFLAWSRQQVEALRTAARDGSNQVVDWQNLAEEIEGLGISQRSALGSQIRRIIQHLPKLEYSRASEPRRWWEDSIADVRIEVEDLLERSPSLRQKVAREIEKQTKHSIRLAISALEQHGEIDAATTARVRTASYAEHQVLGDWFPAEPPARGI